MIRKSLMLAYAGIAYFLSMTALLYVVGFLADLGVPKGISDGKEETFWPSVLIDAGLIGLFGLL